MSANKLSLEEIFLSLSKGKVIRAGVHVYIYIYIYVCVFVDQKNI